MRRDFFPGREGREKIKDERLKMKTAEASLMCDRVTVFTVEGCQRAVSYAWVDGCEAVDLKGRWYVALIKAWVKAKIKIKIKVKDRADRTCNRQLSVEQRPSL